MWCTVQHFMGNDSYEMPTDLFVIRRRINQQLATIYNSLNIVLECVCCFDNSPNHRNLCTLAHIYTHIHNETQPVQIMFHQTENQTVTHAHKLRPNI